MIKWPPSGGFFVPAALPLRQKLPCRLPLIILLLILKLLKYIEKYNWHQDCCIQPYENLRQVVIMASISFDNALGLHAKALHVRAARAEVLANNLANADTPGFKARDINFRAVLAGEVERSQSLSVERTNSGHLAGRVKADEQLLYRNPNQPSIDGNTVETQIEKSHFAKNSMDYNATFEFLSGKFKGLRNAVRGE